MLSASMIQLVAVSSSILIIILTHLVMSIDGFVKEEYEKSER